MKNSLAFIIFCLFATPNIQGQTDTLPTIDSMVNEIIKNLGNHQTDSAILKTFQLRIEPLGCFGPRNQMPIICLNDEKIRFDTTKFSTGRKINGKLITCTDFRKATPKDFGLASQILFDNGWIEEEILMPNLFEIRQNLIAEIPFEAPPLGWAEFYLILLDENFKGIIFCLPPEKPKEWMCKEVDLSK